MPSTFKEKKIEEEVARSSKLAMRPTIEIVALTRQEAYETIKTYISGGEAAGKSTLALSQQANIQKKAGHPELEFEKLARNFSRLISEALA